MSDSTDHDALSANKINIKKRRILIKKYKFYQYIIYHLKYNALTICYSSIGPVTNPFLILGLSSANQF